MNFKPILTILATFLVAINLSAQCTPGAVVPSTWGTPSDFDLGFTSDADITDDDTLQIV